MSFKELRQDSVQFTLKGSNPTLKGKPSTKDSFRGVAEEIDPLYHSKLRASMKKALPKVKETRGKGRLRSDKGGGIQWLRINLLLGNRGRKNEDL